ncbi:hypothetical protein GCM10020258_14270 [Sphingomonas yabuuchiae]
MKRLALCLALVAAPVVARETIGIYKGWGAFRDPDRCYAIAKPVLANGRVGGFASVGTWPAKHLRDPSTRISAARATAPPPSRWPSASAAFRWSAPPRTSGHPTRPPTMRWSWRYARAAA